MYRLKSVDSWESAVPAFSPLPLPVRDFISHTGCGGSIFVLVRRPSRLLVSHHQSPRGKTSSRLLFRRGDSELPGDFVQPSRVQELVDRVLRVIRVVREVLVGDQVVTSAIAGESLLVPTLRDLCREDFVPALYPVGQRPRFIREHGFSRSSHLRR